MKHGQSLPSLFLQHLTWENYDTSSVCCGIHMPIDFGFGCRSHCVTMPKPSSEGHISPLARKKKNLPLGLLFYLFIYFLYYDYSRNLLTRRVECCCVTCFAAASLLPPFFPGSGNIWWRLWRRGRCRSSSPRTTSRRPGRPTWWDARRARTHTHTHIHTHLHTGGEMNATQTTKQSSHTVFDPLTGNNESVCASFARWS